MNQFRLMNWTLAFCLLAVAGLHAEPAAQAAPEADAARGAKLVKLCDTCHTVRGPDQKPVIGELAGGKVMVGTTAGSNLTSSATGLGKYDEKMFRQALREGMVGTRKLAVMNPALFRNMTDDDLHAVWTYLRQLPKVEHIVDNSQPPTACKKCRQTHGGGDKN
ncbi:MAG: cytochrome c [Candidatus Korobacteraceae bacterium]